jgi:predicted CoA-binding protein
VALFERKYFLSKTPLRRLLCPTMSLAVRAVRVPRVTMSSGSGMLTKQRWAVVGNHAKNPVVQRITDRLRAHGKEVHRVNSPGKSMPPAEFNFLGECPGPIDVVDVVCNPAMGMKVVEEALSLGIKAMWFQPGADDPEVVAKARDAGIETHCGCVLVDLPERREANL